MKSTSEWMNEALAQAKAAFANHEMKVIGPGHWQVKRPNDGQYWADIVVMGGVGLAVWGDIDGCFFSYCSGASEPGGVVAWIANAYMSYSYAREKAHIGMGGAELIETYVAEVALYDLQYYMQQKSKEYDEEEWNEPRRGQPTIGEVFTEAFERAKRNIGRCSDSRDIKGVLDDLMEDIRNEEQDAYEWVYSIGQVTSYRVIYAVAAVARLHELLKEKGNAEEEK